MVDGVTAKDDKVAPVYRLEESCVLLHASNANMVKERLVVGDAAPLTSMRLFRLFCYYCGMWIVASLNF